MIKHAIFSYGTLSSSAGGPSGYLWNLKLGLSKQENSFVFLIVSNEEVLSSSSKKHVDFIYLRTILHLFKKGIHSSRKFHRIINQFDSIHVHSSEDLFILKLFLRFKGKIIFTPHRPEPLYREIFNRIKGGKTSPSFIFNYFFKFIEKFSYKYSNAFIFPSKSACKIYMNFPYFALYFSKKETHYLYTGIGIKEVTLSKDDFKSQYNIPLESTIISFIGRHNIIKGFDLFYKLKGELENTKIYTLNAGNYNKNEVITSEYWRELGHLSNVQNLINASDLIVIPNRETYFDLILIEALCHGKLILTSKTGGNIDIIPLTNGIFVFDLNKENDLFQQIKSSLETKITIKKELELSNKKTYFDFFSLEVFSSNYISIINKIHGQKLF